MIKLGHDICSIDRFASFMTKEAFLQKIFGSQELVEASGANQFATKYLAGRWAAKESLSKALGLGVFEWNLPQAQYLQRNREWVFHGSMAKRMQNYQVETSLSYEGDIASAITIIIVK